MKSPKKIILGVIVLIGLAILVWPLARNFFSEPEPPKFRTESIRRGELVEYISATGTIEPEELVDVGAQVGGMIAEFGRDEAGKEIDYGSPVVSDMVLARIDDSLYDAEYRQSEANLLQSQANLLSSVAQLEQLKARLSLAQINFDRTAALLPSGSAAQSVYDNNKAELEAARANLSAGEASIAQARASIASAEASRDRAKRNLGYCVITSPVDGVIIDRRVNIGQTVVSSMSAPSLFLIAKDLKKMEIWVSVNEADIGQISPGQRTIFTVDAFPGEKFAGKVEKIRLNASMSQNVVTYVVEVSTDNSDGRLLPYLTANVDFIIHERSNALLIPNAALRFKPDASLLAPEDQQLLAAGSAAGSVRAQGDRRPAIAWVLRNGRLKAEKIVVGLTDGINSEVLEGSLKEDSVVVTGVDLVNAAAEENSSSNPFLPQFRRPR